MFSYYIFFSVDLNYNRMCQRGKEDSRNMIKYGQTLRLQGYMMNWWMQVCQYRDNGREYFGNRVNKRQMRIAVFCEM